MKNLAISEISITKYNRVILDRACWFPLGPSVTTQVMLAQLLRRGKREVGVRFKEGSWDLKDLSLRGYSVL